MPELPEVEYAAGSLRRFLADAVVERAEAPPTRIFRGSDRGEDKYDYAPLARRERGHSDDGAHRPAGAGRLKHTAPAAP